MFTTVRSAGAGRRGFGIAADQSGFDCCVGLGARCSACGIHPAHSDGHFIFWSVPRASKERTSTRWFEAATGINLWREWARIEVAGGDGSYQLPPVREEYAGVILSLARQEEPAHFQ